jgi:hypothetical protein
MHYKLVDAEVVIEMFDELHARLKDLMRHPATEKSGEAGTLLYKVDGMYHVLEQEVTDATTYLRDSQGTLIPLGPPPSSVRPDAGDRHWEGDEYRHPS